MPVEGPIDIDGGLTAEQKAKADRELRHLQWEVSDFEPRPERADTGDALVRYARNVLADANGDVAEPLMYSADEFLALPEPIDLVPGLIPENGLVFLNGPPKVGKTWVGVTAAYWWSRGEEWEGYRPQTPLRVLIVPAESRNSYRIRLQALINAHGDPGPGLFLAAVGARDLFTRDGKMTERRAEMIEIIGRVRPHLIIIDPLNRHAPGADVSSNADMTMVIEVLDQIRTGFGSAVMVIHHTKKDGSEFLGATSLSAGWDVELTARSVAGGKAFDLWLNDARDIESGKIGTFEIRTTDDGPFLHRTSSLSTVMEGDPMPNRIIVALLERGPSTTAELCQEFGGYDHDNMNSYLRGLRSSGQIESKKVEGVKGFVHSVPEEE